MNALRKGLPTYSSSRVGRDVWRIFALFWAVTLLVDRAKRHGFTLENLATVIAALCVIIFPESLIAFGVLAVSQTFFWGLEKERVIAGEVTCPGKFGPPES